MSPQPTMMRAVEVKDGKGPAESLFISNQIPRPAPQSGQALVKIRAFGLNRMDILQRNGNYPVPPQAGKILGVEFSGVVESLAESDGEASYGGFKAGDEVFGLAYGGAYAEYIAITTKMLLHKPKTMSFEEAAAIPETWITATQALFLVGQFEKGQSVLWHAGASGVSIAGIQLSRLSGASAIYATAGSGSKCDFCVKELGATKAYNYKEQDWSQEILKATDGKGVDRIIDLVGGSYLQKDLDASARDGRIVCLSTMGGKRAELTDMGPIVYKRIGIQGTTLRSRDEDYQGKLRDRLEEYLPHFGTGELNVVIDRVFDWKDIVQAHRTMEGNSTSGKIICLVK